MCSCPPKCDHVFAYWSVVPPSHCLKCGACLTCGERRPPVTVTITSGNVTTAPVNATEFARRLAYRVAQA